MDEIKVHIISSGIGWLEFLNLLIFALTFGISLFNIYYIFNRNKATDLKSEEKDEILRLQSINSYWLRSIFLESFMKTMIVIDLDIKDILTRTDVNKRQVEIRQLTNNIANIINTQIVDDQLQEVLRNEFETFENFVRTMCRHRTVDSEKIVNKSMAFRKKMIDILYDYERNCYTNK